MNKYLSENQSDKGIYLIDNKSWATWVLETNNLSSDQFTKYRMEYEAVMLKFANNARIIINRVNSCKIMYNSWLETHISSYLLFGKKHADTLDESELKRVNHIIGLQEHRQQLINCIEEYEYNEEYENIMEIYNKLLILDDKINTGIDGSYSIWTLIWKIMEENKDARKPERVARKSEEVIEKQSIFKMLLKEYMDLEDLLINKVFTYIETNSLYTAPINKELNKELNLVEV